MRALLGVLVRAMVRGFARQLAGKAIISDSKRRGKSSCRFVTADGEESKIIVRRAGRKGEEIATEGVIFIPHPLKLLAVPYHYFLELCFRDRSKMLYHFPR
jgi:hypothetical protein